MNISLSFLINTLLFNYWCQISDQTDLLLTPFDKNSLLTDCSAQFCSTFCWTVLYWEVRISFYTTQKCVMTSQFSSFQAATYLRDPLKKKRLVFIDMKDIFSAEFIIIIRRRRGQFWKIYLFSYRYDNTQWELMESFSDKEYRTNKIIKL